MGFDTESDLRDAAQESLSQCFSTYAREAVPEFNYGSGRTDLVLVNVSEPYWTYREGKLNIREPITDDQHLISFIHLHGREPITIDRFFELGAQKERYKNKALDWLLSHNFVERTSEGKLRTAPNLRRHITTTIAIEFKISKWRKALQQASKGRSFAEYKYVALDEDHLSPALENQKLFREDSVGLISVGSDGSCEVRLAPRRGSPYSKLYKWKLNEQSVVSVRS